MAASVSQSLIPGKAEFRIIANRSSPANMEQNNLIILDRDGVINHDTDSYIRTPEQWTAIPGSLEAIARLCRENYRVVVITNQSGISRGYYTINTLNRIHQKMLEEVHKFGGDISAIFFCPHSDEDGCDCRKPQPGLFLELQKRLKCNLDQRRPLAPGQCW